MKSNFLLKNEKITNKYSSLFYCLLKVIIAVIAIVLCLIMERPEQIRWALFYLLALNVYLVIVNRRCIYTLVISLFLLWFNYSIYFANYIIEIKDFFTTWAYSDTALVGFKIALIFTVSLCLFTRIDDGVAVVNGIKKMSPKLLIDDCRGHALFGYCYLLLLFLLLIFGFDRPSESGVRGSESTYYEYSVIVFTVGFYFFKWDKFYKYSSMVLLILFALQNILFGGRITALQLLLLLFLVINDEKQISFFKLIPILIIGVSIFTLVGAMRANADFTFNNLVEAFVGLFDKKGVLDTAYAAYYPGLVFIRVHDEIDFQNRLLMLFAFLLSIIFGGKVKNSNLSSFTKNYFMHYGGGVLPFYGFFYLGIIGVVLFAVIVSLYINMIKKTNENSSGFVKCFSIYITVTVPRWYLYSPSQLIRGIMILWIVFTLTSVIVTKNSLLKR